MVYAIFATIIIFLPALKALIISANIPSKRKEKADEPSYIDHLNHDITDPEASFSVRIFYLAKIIGIFVCLLVFLCNLMISNFLFQCSGCHQVLVDKVPRTEHARADVGQNHHH